MFKKVILNTTAQVTTKFVTASTTLLVTILIGRSLGKVGYGEFTLIFAFVAYFYTLADFGLNNIFIKVSPSGDEKTFKLLLGLRLILGTVLALAAIAVSQLLPYDPAQNIGFSPVVRTGILIASITILTQTLLTTANANFQKNLSYHLSTISAIVGSASILIFVAVSRVLHSSLLGYVWAYVLGGICFIVVAYILIFENQKQDIKPVFDIKGSKKILTLAWPVGVALIFNLIYFRVDVLILGASRTTAEVGLYGLAYQFFEAALTIPIFFTNSLYPVLANLFAKDKEKYQKEFKFWLLILTFIGFGLTVALFTVSFVIPYIFGQSFSDAKQPLRILALGLPFFFVSALLWHILIIKNRQKYLTYIYALGAAFNIFANLIFIPSYGYLAAAVITVISEALITLLLVISFKIKSPSKPFNYKSEANIIAKGK